MTKIKIEMTVNEAEWFCDWLLPWLSSMPKDKKQKYITCQKLYDRIRLELDNLYKPFKPDHNPDHF